MGTFQQPPIDRPTRAFRGNAVLALILIAVGAVLFLENIGLLNRDFFHDYWPLVFTAWGLARLRRTTCASGLIWSLGLIAAGILLTLGHLGILHISGSIILPLLLIGLGAHMLINRVQRSGEDAPGTFNARNRHGFHFQSCGTSGWKKSATGKMEDNAIFAGVNRRIDDQNFDGGELNAVFGSVEIDLRHAAISSEDKRAQLECNAVFGGMEIRVPESWRVVMQGDAVFGAFEDKTLPPRPEPGVVPPTLLIRGAAVFGGVVIKN